MVSAPGWYQADGDPPGTQRYWDGQIWVGHPVYEPAPMPVPGPPPPGVVVPPPRPSAAMPPPPPNASALGEGVKVLAIVLSVLKALPLALVAVVFFWVLALSSVVDGGRDDFDEFGDYGLSGLVEFAAIVLGSILVVGLLLLVFQFVGALRGRPMMVFIPAAIMALFDLGLALLAWIGLADGQTAPLGNTDSLQGTLLITAVAGVQTYVAVFALRSNSNQTR